MNKLRFGLAMAAMVAVGAGITTTGHAYDHPHYWHAMSDLRYARTLLDHREEYEATREQGYAIEAIDHAMDEIKRAAFDDGRDMHEHPPVDAGDRHGRLSQVMDLLDSADRDLRFEEDDRAALGWRNAAIQHVEEARGAIHHAMEERHWDEHEHRY